MAGPRKSRGFTLVELLVVITIIGMLVSLLLPAIQAARETGRRNTCMSNMRNASVALMQVHDSKRGFPGYANVVGNKRASWVVTILNQLDQGNVYQNWVNTPLTTAATTQPGPTYPVGTFTTSVPWAYTTLSVLTCPSDPSTSTIPDQLSYVVNTGSARTANDNFPGGAVFEDSNSGVFFNQAGSDAMPSAPTPTQYNPNGTGGKGFSQGTKYKTTMDFITSNDGTSYTLMLSENLQSGNWATDPIDSQASITGNRPADPYQSDFQMRQNTGFVWFITTKVNNVDDGTLPNTDFNPTGMNINQNARDLPSPNPYQTYPLSMTDRSGGLAYARPSSAHTGGVNVIFCGGNHRFIAEEIPYYVYTQLMTPRQSACIVTLSATMNTAKQNGWNYLINEADY
jgi:prepilin-type N-terminal cleavage/methylation domain-containing protein